MPKLSKAAPWLIVGAWLAILSLRGSHSVSAPTPPPEPTSHLVGAPTPFPTPGDAGLVLVSNGQGPMPTWQVPPRNVVSNTDLYINGSTGSNSNLGTTMMSPWGTNAALDKYIGLYGKISPPPISPPPSPPQSGAQWVTIHYEGSIPTDLLNVQSFLDANICLRIVGTDLVTSLHTGTISAAVNYSNSNVLASITDPSVSSWTTYANKRITWTGGSAVGAHAWIAKDIGSNSARISPSATLNDVVLTGISFPTPVAPSTGTYTIDSLPTLYVGLLDTQATSNGNSIEPFVEFLDLNLASTGPIGADPNPTGVAVTYLVQGCSSTWQAISGAQIVFTVSALTNGFQALLGSSVTLVASYVTTAARYLFGAFGAFYDNTLLEGTGLVVGDGAYVEVDGIAVEGATTTLGNATGDAVVNVLSYFAQGTIAIRGPVVGSGNAGVGVRVAAGTTITASQLPTVTGTLGDFALGSAAVGYAWIPATASYDPVPITFAWANMTAPLVAGGFGGEAHDPGSDTHFVGPSSTSGGYAFAGVPLFQQQAARVVDPANASGCASDSNATCSSMSCTTGDGPCLTHLQVGARELSPTPRHRQSTTETFISSQSSDLDPIVMAPLMDNQETEILQCALPAPVFTGTLSGVVAKNRPSGQLLEANLGASAAVGQLIINTTHPSRAFVMANVSGNLFTISAPGTARAIPATGGFTNVDTWANSDAFSLYNLYKINVVSLKPTVVAGQNSSFVNETMQVYQCMLFDPLVASLPPPLNFATMHVNSMVSMTECVTVKTIDIEPSGEPFDRPYYTNVDAIGGYTGGSTMETGGTSSPYFIGHVSIWGGQIYETMRLHGANLDHDVAITNGVASLFEDGGLGHVYSSGPLIIKGAADGSGDASVAAAIFWGPGTVDVAEHARLTYSSSQGATASFLSLGGTMINGSSTACSHTGANPDVANCTVAVSGANADAAPGGLLYAIGGGSIAKSAN